MVAVFEALSELVDLHVVFCAESSSRGSGWEFGELPFSSEVVGGTTIWTEHPDAINYFLSPRIQLAGARRRPEAIISAGYSVPALYANAWAVASRTPLAIQSDGTPFSERNLSRVQRGARALLLRVASAAVANSRESVERFAQLGVRRDRIFSAPHSTHVERFQRAARERRRDARAPVRVLAVGRLLPRKGLDRLVRAMGRGAREQDVQLVLAGSGPEEGSLRRLA